MADKRLDDELHRDVPPGRAEGAPESDLGPALENADDHDVGDADGAEAEQQRREGALCGHLGLECVGGALDLEIRGGLRCGSDRERRPGVVDAVVVRADDDA